VVALLRQATMAGNPSAPSAPLSADLAMLALRALLGGAASSGAS
jgi:hypothetical protein